MDGLSGNATYYYTRLGSRSFSGRLRSALMLLPLFFATPLPVFGRYMNQRLMFVCVSDGVVSYPFINCRLALSKV